MIENDRVKSLCEYFNILCNSASYNNNDMKDINKLDVIYDEMMKIIGESELLEFKEIHGKIK